MIVKQISSKLTAKGLSWLVKDQHLPVFLDSGMDKERLGRYSIVAWSPTRVFTAKGQHCCLKDACFTIEALSDPLTFLMPYYKESLIEINKKANGNLPFYGGWIGYFAYDLGRQFEKLPLDTVDDIQLPDCHLAFYNQTVVFDHMKDQVWLISLTTDEEALSRLYDIEVLLTETEEPNIELIPLSEEPVFKGNFEKEAYIQALSRLRAFIRTGDIYQANLTQRFQTKMVQSTDQLYYKLRSVNPAPFAAYLPFENGALLSSSPERFIAIRDGYVETRPIKGTRPRGETAEADEAFKKELIESEKDRAELLMIVDLERNDLSRIAEKGSVKVPELMVLESYPTVHHLVATVTAKLKPELNALDVIRATFPGGSITGAPKIRAMEVIEMLEPTQRSAYTGSIGYLCVSGDMDLNIVIRTIICHNGEAYFQAGGGITWDSVEEEEYLESLQKAKALKRALSI